MNGWHFWAITYPQSPNLPQIYVDGLPVPEYLNSDTAAPMPWNMVNSSLYLGDATAPSTGMGFGGSFQLALFRTVAAVETPAQILQDYQSVSTLLAPYGIRVGTQQERLQRAIVVNGDSREVNVFLQENFTQSWMKLAFDKAGVESSWTNFAIRGQPCGTTGTVPPPLLSLLQQNKYAFFDGQTAATKIAYNGWGGRRPFERNVSRNHRFLPDYLCGRSYEPLWR